MNDSFEEKEQQGKNNQKTPPPPPPNWQQCQFPVQRQRPIIGGIIVILVGVALLVQRIPGIDKVLPAWLFTWPMILILIGIFSTIKNRNLVSGGIFFLIGLFFLLATNGILSASFQPFLIPVLIILFGFFLLLHRNKRTGLRAFRDHIRKQQRHSYQHHQWHNVPPFPFDAEKSFAKESTEKQQENTSGNTEDFIDINTVFGSADKKVFSKNFQGGTVSYVFGGGKINLVHSDIKEKAILNFSINFGGANLFVPANWIVINELSVLFGGIEDKRPASSFSDENKKILILRGNLLCGGIEIRSL